MEINCFNLAYNCILRLYPANATRSVDRKELGMVCIYMRLAELWEKRDYPRRSIMYSVRCEIF
jgi:hypothetical protein